MSTTQAEINEFLQQRTLAIVGMSRSANKFGNAIFRELTGKGYRLLPVHPEAATLEGVQCTRSLAELPEKIGGLIVSVPPARTEALLPKILNAGITRVWFSRGSESNAALTFCQDHGITAIHGHCILMFAEPVGSFHGFHRWVWKLIGKYPKAARVSAA